MRNLLLYLLLLFGIFSCSVEGKKVNSTDWAAVKSNLLERNDFKELKQAYISDKIQAIIEDAQRLNSNRDRSFSELIDRYSLEYDSLLTVYKNIRKTNQILDEIIEIKKAESVSLDADRGFIIFKLNFTKVFADSIDYMILRYQYIDDYDQLYFTEDSKLSYQAAKNFEGELQAVMTDIFNGQNEIIYLNTELSAAEVLRDNYGIEAKTESLEKEYLSNGLKVMVSAVKFHKGGIMKRRDGDWEYLKPEI